MIDAATTPEPDERTGDDDRPLGDTPEAHDEISVHDLPIDHPGRQAAAAMAREKNGTTRGHRQGGAHGGELGDEERSGAEVRSRG